MIDKLLIMTMLWQQQVAYAGAQEEPFHFNMPSGVTAFSRDVYALHMLVFWVCCVIGIGVFAVMAWSMLRHRSARGVVPARFSGNTKLEIVWTVIPALILVAVAIVATRTLLAINANPPPAWTVDIHASQWRWHYSYAGQNVAFYSNLTEESRNASRKDASDSPQQVAYYLRDVDHPLVLPVGEPILLRITSDDVIHSWWVPELGFKRDAIPGFINQATIVIDTPGTYRGQCAELCGAGHALMPIVVEAVPPQQFRTWLQQGQQAVVAAKASQQEEWTSALAMAQGENIFKTVCAACHQLDGKGIANTFPALDGSKVVNGPLQAHLKFVIHGSPRNPVMRAFGKEMDNRQLAAVITYERNAWSNHTGDLVTPKQVEEAR